MTLARSDRFHQPKNARPSLPWIVRFLVSIASTVIDNAFRPNGTANRRLAHLLDYQINPSKSTHESDSVSSSDVSVDPSRNLWFRLYSPSTSNNQLLPVVIFFHGGGFSFLSPASLAYDMVCRNFAFKLPTVVISVNYRLAPEHRYPSQYEDGLDVLNFIDENNATLLPKNADPSRCFFAGDSAGANLAHHVAVRACQTELRTLKVIGLISIQPFFRGEERTESEKQLVAGPLLVSMPRTDWCWKAFLPEGSNRDHPASNVSGPNSTDISRLNFPATMVVIGGFDPLKDWQRRNYEWLRKSGKMASLIEYTSMIHSVYLFPILPEASQLIIQIKNFIVKCSSSQVSNSISATSEAPAQVSPPYPNLIKIYLEYFQLYIGLFVCMFGLLFSFLYKM